MKCDPPEEKARDLASALQDVAELLDHIRGVSFFAKDTAGRFIAANRAFLKLCGVREVPQLAGRTDADFFEPARARLYMEDDRKVVATGKPMDARIEPGPGAAAPSGPDLVVTTKIPVRGGDGGVCAVAGICLDLADAALSSVELGEFAAVLRLIEEAPPGPLDVAGLAARQGMSVSKFERHFKKLFLATPAAYHDSVRMRRARHELACTSKSVGQIASELGFYDQSHFTKRFRKECGTTPLRFRRAAGRSPRPLLRPSEANP